MPLLELSAPSSTLQKIQLITDLGLWFDLRQWREKRKRENAIHFLRDSVNQTGRKLVCPKKFLSATRSTTSPLRPSREGESGQSALATRIPNSRWPLFTWSPIAWELRPSHCLVISFETSYTFKLRLVAARNALEIAFLTRKYSTVIP